jgi:glycosyltransferase involved in cell wall biosynthesis
MDDLPFVSICTPTFNRRPFIPYLIKCFDNQDYPKEKMEWIIIDDGTDKIEDLVKDHSQIKYFYYEKKMPLGKKRNLLHEKSKGEILVYMDDDDYYPPTRVSHAVKKLLSDDDVLCAGSSRLFIYYDHIDKIYQFGPYGKNHATAGTFAFKRKLLDSSYYDNDACLAEEKVFLKDYTVPFIQLDPEHVILVFSHIHNTFDKKKLLENIDNKFVKQINNFSISQLIPDKDLYSFYKENLNNILKDYTLGRPESKPDVLQNIILIEEKRRQILEDRLRKSGQIIMKQNDGSKKVLSNDETIKVIQQQQMQIVNLQNQIKNIKEILIKKQEEIDTLKLTSN